MKLTKEITNYFHFFFDEILPPRMRDSKWLMIIPFKILFREKAVFFFEFKQNVAHYSEKKLKKIYQETLSVHIKRESDLNALSLDKVLNSIQGVTVLDVGCGRGYLANELSKQSRVFATDFIIDAKMAHSFPGTTFTKANCIQLPFRNHSFDTVICSHTLEHVRDFQSAVIELRRVAKQRLIIVVPKQRAYKYTFDLHLHFFPYPHSLVAALGQNMHYTFCEELNRDLVYFEDYR